MRQNFTGQKSSCRLLTDRSRVQIPPCSFSLLMERRLLRKDFDKQLEERVIREVSSNILQQLDLYQGRAIHVVAPARSALQELLEIQGKMFQSTTFGALRQENGEVYDTIRYWLYKCFSQGAFTI